MKPAFLMCCTIAIPLLLGGCKTQQAFKQDVAFLDRYVEVIVLSNDSAGVAVVPQYQGRVMTSTATGDESFGWINYEAIASQKLVPHMNAFGGEERFWMGPEGGQFAIFFEKGDEFTFDDWQTPAVIDTETYDVVSKSAAHASFRKQTQLTNMSGTKFDLQIDRTVRILDKSQVQDLIGIPVPESIELAAFESSNRITNTGSNAWTKESGMLSIWLLNMLKHSKTTTIVMPFKAGPESEFGPRVNDSYFGKVPADRLVVKEDVAFMSADGQYRSKIGINPKRAKPIVGSYDANGKVLTLVHFTLPEAAGDYVNSIWAYQEDPFSGDAVNAYNDGPPAPGQKAMGPFYELETSSPAAALQPGQSIDHVQRTIHLKGSPEELDKIAQKTLGVTLEAITSAL